MLSSRLRYQGTYVYAQNLLAEFKKMAEAESDLNFCLFQSQRAANDANAIEPGQNFELATSRWLARDRLWRLGGVGLAASSARADMIFSPTSSILPLGRIPVVCAVHDVTPVVMPSNSRKTTLLQRAMLWSACKYSKAVITVSECSKRDLVRTCRVPESKVFVVHNGYDDTCFNDAAPDRDRQEVLKRKYALTRPYLWHHGVIQPRKNLKRLIDAYRLMLARNLQFDFDLVLAGPLGWKYQEILAAANDSSGHRGRVVLAGALEGADLVCLLKGASLVVVPSLYEGFCLPMVEAMACGVPTVAADASCLPEVSGGALKYFDPRSVDDMASCMASVLDSEAIRTDLARRGAERSQAFSWRRSAEETVRVLRRHAA